MNLLNWGEDEGLLPGLGLFPNWDSLIDPLELNVSNGAIWFVFFISY
jgi:hypothetical protein